jgi:hypothetical protein
VKTQLLVSPFPDMHLATLAWRDGKPEPKCDDMQRILYSTRGNDTAQLFLVNELYDTAPAKFIDLNLQSWTFAIRKAQMLRGTHYVFWSEEHHIAAIMALLKTPRHHSLTFVPLRVKPRPKREPFRDLMEVPGSEYFERLAKFFADSA